ncbi:MAG: TIM barrel protein [Peptostreptococcaceae bacterium]|nr:TIM barrel protein [Peptostreptococcaceae bacterium]
MLQLINLPLDDELIDDHGGVDGLQKLLDQTGCDSIEWVWGGRKIHTVLPPAMTQGYHLTFYSDWLDLYLGDREKLLKKFGSEEVIRDLYGGIEPSVLIHRYKEDLERALSLGAKYVVFHISDVSIEEGYTYEKEHSDEQVFDACAEIINEIMSGVDTKIDFLIENLWWAGFRFDHIERTKYILDKIEYEHKGIMLDTGHLLNTEPALRSEREGIRYIQKMLDHHKEIQHLIKGIHLNLSLSGEYVRSAIGRLSPIGESYFEKFSNSYAHILQLDQHRAFTDPLIGEVIREIAPRYLVHELRGSTIEEKIEMVKRQRATIGSF